MTIEHQICGHDPRKQTCPNMRKYRTGPNDELDLGKYAAAHPNKPISEFSSETWPQFLARSARESTRWHSGITTDTEEKRAIIKAKGKRKSTNNMTNSGMRFMD